MNWFQKLWNNPNVHVALGTVTQLASAFFPQYAVPLLAIGGTLSTVGIALPEAPRSVTIPLPTATGSPHTADYVNAALNALGVAPPPLPASGSLHADHYVAIINALTSKVQAMQPPPAPTGLTVNSQGRA